MNDIAIALDEVLVKLFADDTTLVLAHSNLSAANIIDYISTGQRLLTCLLLTEE